MTPWPMTPFFLVILMSLGTYRLTRLLVDDKFPPSVWLRDRVIGGWRPLAMGETFHRDRDDYIEVDGEQHRYVRRSKRVPFFFASLLSCPYCVSGWVALGITVGVWWWLVLSVPLLVLLWLSSWALGGLLAAQDWS